SWSGKGSARGIDPHPTVLLPNVYGKPLGLADWTEDPTSIVGFKCPHTFPHSSGAVTGPPSSSSYPRAFCDTLASASPWPCLSSVPAPAISALCPASCPACHPVFYSPPGSPIARQERHASPLSPTLA